MAGSMSMGFQECFTEGTDEFYFQNGFAASSGIQPLPPLRGGPMPVPQADCVRRQRRHYLICHPGILFKKLPLQVRRRYLRDWSVQALLETGTYGVFFFLTNNLESGLKKICRSSTARNGMIRLLCISNATGLLIRPKVIVSMVRNSIMPYPVKPYASNSSKSKT